jgi:biopolymer transport protein ExbD
MRSIRRAHNPERLDPNLTPLLDVVLQLITFFMMLIHFGTQIEGATLAVRLPTAPTALPGGEMALDRLPVALDTHGRLLYENVAREGPAAESFWANQADERRKGFGLLANAPKELPTLVVLRADKQVPYGKVRSALESAQIHGFGHFTLVVLREVDR